MVCVRVHMSLYTHGCVCSCVFVWRLSPELTIRMRQRLSDLQPASTLNSQHAPQQKVVTLR